MHTLHTIIDSIRSNLTEDIRSDVRSEHPLSGYCHVASEALFYMLGGKDAGYEIYQAKGDDGLSHWWVQKVGAIYDITSEQYTDRGEVPPYEKGKKRCPSQRGYIPTKKAKLLMERIDEQKHRIID